MAAKRSAVGAYVKKRRSSRNASLLILILGTAALIAADQFTKFLVRANLTYFSHVSLLGIVQIVNINNTGSVFGLLRGTQPFLIELGLTAAAVLLVAYLHFERPIHKISAMIIIAGILGNTIDRISRGMVTDFIYIKPWPAFNLADALLFTGTVFLIASLILPQKEHLLHSRQDKHQRKKKSKS